MSRLDELIAELCPDRVEYKALKEVYKRLKGTPITAGKMKEIDSSDGEIRVFAGGKTVINAHAEDIPKANITRVPAVLVQSRGVIDVVYYDKPFTFKNEMWAYTHDKQVSVKYLYYVLKKISIHLERLLLEWVHFRRYLLKLQMILLYPSLPLRFSVKLSVSWTISQSLQQSLQKSLL